MCVSRAGAHEAQGTFVYMFLDVDVWHASDLAAEAMLDHVGISGDAGLASLERGQNLVLVVPDGRDNAQTRNDDTTHAVPLLWSVTVYASDAGGCKYT